MNTTNTTANTDTTSTATANKSTITRTAVSTTSRRMRLALLSIVGIGVFAHRGRCSPRPILTIYGVAGSMPGPGACPAGFAGCSSSAAIVGSTGDFVVDPSGAWGAGARSGVGDVSDIVSGIASDIRR